MKNLKIVWILPLMLAALVAGCINDPGYTLKAVELTAGSPVDAEADDTSAQVIFTGAAGLTLENTDFTVTAGGTIAAVAVSGGTAAVTVQFAANEDADEKTYTVGISSGSTVIKGDGKVTITQGYAGDTRKTLTAGAAVIAAAGDTAAPVEFSGAAGLTLEVTDFTVNSGGTVSNVTIAGGTATVTISFAANSDTAEKTYTVGIAPDSTVIKGSGMVTITQSAKVILHAFYVSFSEGDDENNGSQSNPWKTIAKVNQRTFEPGEAILFKSGDTWSWQAGDPSLAPLGSGTEGDPILISSYGAGAKPVFRGNGVVNDVIHLHNQQHWEISRLEITNTVTGFTNPTSRDDNQGSLIANKDLRGIHITGNNGQTLSNFHLHDLYIHDVTGEIRWIGGSAASSGPGFILASGWDASKRTGGILVEGQEGSSATIFNNVMVENSVFERNSFGAFTIKQYQGNASTPTYWAEPRVTSYPYNDTNFKPHTNITVRGNYIDQTGWYHGNGLYFTSVRGALVEENVIKNPGVCGIELYWSDSITVQHNEVYGSTSKGGGGDTNGIDPDIKTSNIIIQYNYVHDNGDGILVCGGTYNTVIIRYNVLYNNRTRWIRDAVSGGIIQVYNNVLYNTQSQSTAGTIQFTGASSTGSDTWEFKNNVFYNAHAGTANTSFMTGTTYTYSNNLYYGVTAPAGDTAAVSADPAFTGVPAFLTGTSAATRFQDFSRLMPAAGSPLINLGVDYTPQPTRIDAVPNGKDYAGVTLTGKADIGLYSAVFNGLSGVVTNEVNQKVTGAIVSLNETTSTTTDANGKYSFTPVSAGTYGITVTADNFMNSTTNFVVSEDAASWLPLSTGAFTGGSVNKDITGIVTSDGLPLAGVTVAIGKGAATSGSTTTGADGTYTIPNIVPSDGYTITASKDGYQSGSIPNYVVPLLGVPDPANFNLLLKVIKPVAVPGTGSMLFSGDTITLSTTTAGAVSYYTLDGSTPDTGGSAYGIYDGPIVLTSFPVTVKAIGAKEGLADSDMLETTYTQVQPKNVTYSGLTAGGVTINWDAVTGATGYELSVYHADGETASVTPATNTANITAVLSAGKNYYARVRAKKGALYSAYGIVRFQLDSAPRVLWEDFETNAASALPWTLSSSGGTVSQTIVDYFPGNKSGKYYFQGTGGRYTKLNLKSPIAVSDKVTLDFDWYMNNPNRGQGRITISDSSTGNGSANAFITFSTSVDGKFHYYLGNFSDSENLPSTVTVTEIPSFPTPMNFWSKLTVTLDFTNKKINFEIVDTRDGSILAAVNGLDFAAGITYANSIGALRLLASRPDGTNPTSGWITYLDNVAVYGD